MTTLAQMLISSQPDSDEYDRAIWEIVNSRLTGSLPSTKHVAFTFSPEGEENPGIAEKFIFHEPAPDTVKELQRAGAVDPLTVIHSARIPAEIAWVEWTVPNIGLRMGALIDTLAGVPESKRLYEGAALKGPLLVICCGDLAEDFAKPLFCATVGELPCREESGGLPGVIHWRNDFRGHALNDFDFKTFLGELIRCLFLITVPRVCEVRDVIHSSKLQKARAKRGKLPLLEYKHMVLKVGVGSVRYRGGSRSEGNPDTEGAHKRLHQVIGHFRTYREHREAPLVSWVPPHWRGDAELGIVMHNREVKR